MSEIEPIPSRPSAKGSPLRHISMSGSGSGSRSKSRLRSKPVSYPLFEMTRFNRFELNQILNVYGRMVAAGEWRDYAIDMLREKAVFSVFRKASEYPLYRIEKNPRLARKQGIYSVITPTGLILKRGHDLRRVLAALDKKLRLVEA